MKNSITALTFSILVLLALVGSAGAKERVSIGENYRFATSPQCRDQTGHIYGESRLTRHFSPTPQGLAEAQRIAQQTGTEFQCDINGYHPIGVSVYFEAYGPYEREMVYKHGGPNLRRYADPQYIPTDNPVLLGEIWQYLQLPK